MHRVNSFTVQHIYSYGHHVVALGIVSRVLERGLDMDCCMPNLTRESIGKNRVYISPIFFCDSYIDTG